MTVCFRKELSGKQSRSRCSSARTDRSAEHRCDTPACGERSFAIATASAFAKSPSAGTSGHSDTVTCLCYRTQVIGSALRVAGRNKKLNIYRDNRVIKQQGKARQLLGLASSQHLQGKDNLSHLQTAAKRRSHGRDLQGDSRRHSKRFVILPPASLPPGHRPPSSRAVILWVVWGEPGSYESFRSQRPTRSPLRRPRDAQRGQTEQPSADFSLDKPTHGPACSKGNWRSSCNSWGHASL